MCIRLRKPRQLGLEPDNTKDTIEDKIVNIYEDRSPSSDTEVPEMAIESPSET